MKLILFALLAALPLAAQFPAADAQIEDAVRSGLIPGAVLQVGHGGQVICLKAFGSRALIPQRETMTTDTIFDAASLTKVVATTPSVMKLLEEGKIRIDDPVTKYLPEFQDGKSDITIRLLMTHFSGMPPDVQLVPRWTGHRVGIEKALHAVPIAPPGAKFIYSDINFLLMAEIVERVSGKSVAQFAHDEIYAPLGMKDTGYLPDPSLRARIAPTEIDPDTGQPLRGVVHDPTSRYMGGVAGHAGLFTTAADLGRYAQMLLNKGELNGVRIFSPATVELFTRPASPADQPALRGLGWDIDSPFSANRGELFPIGSYGHTGFTGTSIWIDPFSNTYVVLLTNAVHPHGGKSTASLRSRVATCVAAAEGYSVPDTVALTGYRDTITGAGVHRLIDRNAVTQTGLDVLEANGFQELRGKRIGLITNHTGLDAQGRRNVDIMVAAGVNVTTLFSPEHGISGTQDSAVGDSRDGKTGLPIVSLFEPDQKRLPSAKLADLDAVVFDIQDVGARFYTYSCTLLYAVEEAGKAHKPIYVLDRPNPITGTHVEGPMLDADLHSFVGCYDLPLRHGMTLGELANMANAQQSWHADLHVVRMASWERGDWLDATDLTWVNPSPNMRSLNAALLYPGIAMLEYSTNYSVGRGTDSPFEQVGADWIDGRALATFLNKRWIPGVRVYPTRFRPSSGPLKDKDVSGVRFVITDRNAFDSTRLGIELAAALQHLYPGQIDFDRCRTLIGSKEVVDMLKAGRDASVIWELAQQQAASFDAKRKAFLLY